jgi:hypothetical protein
MITKMFEGIRPEDFLRETSAVRTVNIPAAIRSLGLEASEVGFELFIQNQLAACRKDVTDRDEFVPRAVLGNSDEWRIFHGEDDEVPDDFARRLNRESNTMNAHWCFTALIAPGRALLPGQTEPPPLDSDDTTAMEQAIREGLVRLGVCWTAASVLNGPLTYRGGIIYLDNDGLPDGEVAGDMDPNIEDPFVSVLTPRN